MASPCPVYDDAFGPAINEECRGGFDFTLLFEQSMLGILPAAIFLLAFPARFAYLARQEEKTLLGPTRRKKLALSVLFFALQLGLLVLWGLDKPTRPKVSIASATLNLVLAVQLLGLTWAEDSRSVRPSSLLNTYLLVTLVFDLGQARTLWLQRTRPAIAGIFTASLILKAFLLLLEARGKEPYLKAKYRGLPPESTSGILSRSVLWWINPLFRLGLSACLRFSDLYVLDEALTSSYLHDKMRLAWDRRRKPERRFEFPLATCKALWWPLLLAALPRVCLIGLTFAQPFLISRVLDLLAQPSDPVTMNIGYGLIGATALIYLGIAVSTLHYNQNLHRFVTMFRGATVSLIYRHAIELSDGLYDESAAVTLMSTDVDRIVLCLIDLNECWARLIEVAIGIVLLARQLGWVCIMPIIVVFVSFLGATQISKSIGGRQKVWVEAVQKRIAITSSVLADMRSVKMMGLTRVLTSMVQQHRVEETHRMAAYRWSIVWQNIIQNLPWALAPALTFTVYALQAVLQGRASIGTTQAFTSLSIITLLTMPTAKLLSSIPSTTASTGCFDRIQKFLVSPVRRDVRRTLPLPLSASARPLPKPEVFSEGITHPHRHDVDIDSNDGNRVAIQIHQVDLRPAPLANVLLRNINLSVPAGSLTMIIGPVGAGKTTLLKAILGEIVPDKGDIFVSKTRIGLSMQTSWLPNTTIRSAICGNTDSAEFDAEWYHTTLRACALDHDIDLLSEGDDARIGAGSTVLSGGQKHRVSLARVVYSRAKIVLLDDILGSLDISTQNSVVTGLFGETGLLRKARTTTLLVTHSTNYLHYADNIVVVSDGVVRSQGTYDQVVRTGIINGGLLDSEPGSDTAATSQASLDPNDRAPRGKEANGQGDTTTAAGDFSVYRYYFRRVGWVKASVFVGFVIMEVFCSTFSQIWLKWWTDAGGGRLAFYTTIYVSLALLVSVGLGGYIWAMLILISPSTARRFHAIILKTVMKAPQSFFSTTDTGTILNRFSQDMTLIEGQLATGVLVAVSNFFMSIASAALVATGSSYMAISIPFLILIICVLQHVYLRTSRQLRLLDLEAKSPLYSHFLESLRGVTTIRAFGWGQQFNNVNDKLLDHSQRPYYLLYCIQRWLNLVLDLIVGAEAILVVGLAVGLRASSNPGLLGVSLNNVLSFNSNLASLVTGWTMLETSLGSIARVKSFEETVKSENKSKETCNPSAAWPDRGGIEFCDVTASHNPTTVGIRNITLNIRPGQHIGICGRTGSGKSSLVATLLRLLEIDSGTIFIDGVDLSTVPRDTIRERLVVIPQDPMILVGNVRLNVDPASQKPDATLITALERVGLWDILRERGGLDAEVTSSSLSQGQQQLLALARAILTPRKIVLLDEPTSSVDADTDATMQRVLLQDFADCTIVTVAHRINTIVGSDILVVMENGTVVDIGVPDEVLGRRGSLHQISTSH